MIVFEVFLLFLVCVVIGVGTTSLISSIHALLILSSLFISIYLFGVNNYFMVLGIPSVVYFLFMLNFLCVFRYKMIKINQLKTLIINNEKIKLFIVIGENSRKFWVKNNDGVFWEICLYLKRFEQKAFRGLYSTHRWKLYPKRSWDSPTYFEDLISFRDEFLFKINSLGVLNFKADIFHLYYAIYYFEKEKLLINENKRKEKVTFESEKRELVYKRTIKYNIPDFK